MNTTKTIQMPCQRQTCHANVQEGYFGVAYRTQRISRVRSKWTPGLHQHYQEYSSWHLEELILYCNARCTQTGRSQRDCWPTDGCKANAAQPSLAVWKEMAGLIQAYRRRGLGKNNNWSWINGEGRNWTDGVPVSRCRMQRNILTYSRLEKREPLIALGS